MSTKYRVVASGYRATGIGDDPATQREADQYDTPPYGYIYRAETRLGIPHDNGTYKTAKTAQAVAAWITSVEAVDCYGVVVANARVEAVDAPVDAPVDAADARMIRLVDAGQ